MFLTRVELTNVRCIRSMTLPLETSSGVTRKWTLLLGDNGVGKSTLMRSIGLVLAGSSALAELIGDPDSLARFGEQECTISADLETADGEKRHISLKISRGDTIKEVYETNKETLELLDRAIARASRNYLVIAYGASRRLSSTRLSTQPVTSRFRHPRANNVATLFSPDAMLNPLETWAIDLHYRRQDEGLEIIHEAMRKLLPGMKFKGIDRERRDLMFETVDGDVPLAYLSDGYQNMAAWCGDLLFRVTDTFEDYKDPLAARGVLIVDEIDLHLHPVWQRQLRNFLSDMFPNFQFILTTHSPLTAQQAGAGELFVIRRAEARRRARAETHRHRASNDARTSIADESCLRHRHAGFSGGRNDEERFPAVERRPEQRPTSSRPREPLSTAPRWQSRPWLVMAC